MSFDTSGVGTVSFDLSGLSGSGNVGDLGSAASDAAKSISLTMDALAPFRSELARTSAGFSDLRSSFQRTMDDFNASVGDLVQQTHDAQQYARGDVGGGRQAFARGPDVTNRIDAPISLNFDTAKATSEIASAIMPQLQRSVDSVRRELEAASRSMLLQQGIGV